MVSEKWVSIVVGKQYGVITAKDGQLLNEVGVY